MATPNYNRASQLANEAKEAGSFSVMMFAAAILAAVVSGENWKYVPITVGTLTGIISGFLFAEAIRANYAGRKAGE